MTAISHFIGPAKGDPAMSRRTLLLGGGFALTAGAAAILTPHLHEHTIGHAKLADVVPKTAGVWSQANSGPFVVPEDNQTDGFYDQVLTRAFAAPGQPLMMLLIAYGAAQSGMMKVHRPEVCFASAGFKISGDHLTDIPVGGGKTITGKGFMSRLDDRNERVLYWTRISNAFPSDLVSQRTVMVERGLAGVIPDGVLVRISTPGQGQVGDTEPAMKVFAKSLVASSDPMGRALLLGSLKPSVEA